MKLIWVAALLCVWDTTTASAPRVAKTTLSVRNPKTVTVTEHVYFDVKIKNYFRGEDLEGSFVVAVFGDLLPMTSLNFVSIAKGYQKGKQYLSYNNTVIHRIVPDFVIQMGDIDNQFGRGGTSMFGPTFPDEAFPISHASSGIVSMANTGADANASQFFITLQPARFLDGHHVAFGKVIAGMDFVKKIGSIASFKSGVPMKMPTIVACGIEGLQRKYQLKNVHLETNSEDLDINEFIESQSRDD